LEQYSADKYQTNEDFEQNWIIIRHYYYSPYYGYRGYGYHPFGYHPFGYHPFGYHPFGYHPFGYNPFGYHPNSQNLQMMQPTYNYPRKGYYKRPAASRKFFRRSANNPNRRTFITTRRFYYYNRIVIVRRYVRIGRPTYVRRWVHYYPSNASMKVAAQANYVIPETLNGTKNTGINWKLVMMIAIGMLLVFVVIMIRVRKEILKKGENVKERMVGMSEEEIFGGFGERSDEIGFEKPMLNNLE